MSVYRGGREGGATGTDEGVERETHKRDLHEFTAVHAAERLGCRVKKVVPKIGGIVFGLPPLSVQGDQGVIYRGLQACDVGDVGGSGFLRCWISSLPMPRVCCCSLLQRLG